jgi:hypothetical protein
MGLFLILLPVVNALLDWPSWLLSRWLGRDLLKRLGGNRFQQLWTLSWHGTVDLLGAAVFLILLALLLPRAVGLFLDVTAPLVGGPDAALGAYLCRAAQDPLGSGLWASAMLFSTLVPTALHLMFLIASPLAFWARPHGQVWQERAAYLRRECKVPPEADLPENPSLRELALTDAGLLRETATKVAWWRIRQTLLLYPAALLLAVGLLFMLWELIQAVTGSLPAWLLLIATGNRAFVDSCLPGAL